MCTSVFYRAIGRAVQRAHRMFAPRPQSIEVLPEVIITEPFRYHNLIKLLRPSSPDIALLSEKILYDRDPFVYPHKYYLRVELAETVRGQRTIKTLNVTVKVLGFKRANTMEKKNISFKMEKEIAMYLNVVQEFDQYQMTCFFFDRKYSELFPLCYGCSLSLENDNAEEADHSAAILLQNLDPLGFEQIGEPCDFEVAKLILNRLAQLHATPIAMSMHLGNRFVSMRETYLRRHRSFEHRDVLEEQRRILLAITPDSYLYPYMGMVSCHLQRYANNAHRDYGSSTEVHAWSTISHGKCSLRHIMYKPADRNGPADLKFLDPAHMEYDSCLSDLTFFMLTSVSAEVLDDHYNDLLTTYHTEFTRCMSLAYINLADHSFPSFRNEFEKKVVCNIGAILFEIGNLHYDNLQGWHHIMGATYKTRIEQVIKFMVMKNWLQV